MRTILSILSRPIALPSLIPDRVKQIHIVNIKIVLISLNVGGEGVFEQQRLIYGIILELWIDSLVSLEIIHI